jgi:chitodextrinase
MQRKAPITRPPFDFTLGRGTVIVPLEGTWVSNTVDTGQVYKGIMLSDGTVRAIPVDAVAPVPPTGLARVIRLTSVSLTWTAVPGVAHYQVSRDGANIGTSTSTDFRDTTVSVGNTYSYTVSSVDQYQQRSPPSASVSATVDLSLNSAPTDVVITCWPTPLPTDGPAFVRVNAREIDVHDMAMALNVDAGSLQATNDPSVWIIRI